MMCARLTSSVARSRLRKRLFRDGDTRANSTVQESLAETLCGQRDRPKAEIVVLWGTMGELCKTNYSRDKFLSRFAISGLDLVFAILKEPMLVDCCKLDGKREGTRRSRRRAVNVVARELRSLRAIARILGCSPIEPL
ncbi:hypothetical protein C6341_g14537 [Phytophthora cactorum]|nr:hypothetical protein PC120_g9993 [Phytophthora cactorum]KAG3158104.1 hypothetical protein C6341_g14537 [Phytophthora cactorum]